MVDFNSPELKLIELVSHGWEHREIAELTGWSRDAIKGAIRVIYNKAGIKRNIATLSRWAMENCLDGPVPDTPENRPMPGMPKSRRQRIKLGAIAAREEQEHSRERSKFSGFHHVRGLAGTLLDLSPSQNLVVMVLAGYSRLQSSGGSGGGPTRKTPAKEFMDYRSSGLGDAQRFRVNAWPRFGRSKLVRDASTEPSCLGPRLGHQEWRELPVVFLKPVSLKMEVSSWRLLA